MKIKNIKTTIAGIAVLLGTIFSQVGAVLDDDPSTVFSWEVIWPAIVGIGLLFSKDHDK